MKKLTLVLALPAILACAPAPGGQLLGSKWTISTIDGAPAVSARARMEFLPGRISATVGCNGMGGAWKARGNRLETGPFVSTQMYCDGLMDQEMALSALFEAKPTFTLQGNRLTLNGGGHRVELARAR
jgi:heat shock protein HslJ